MATMRIVLSICLLLTLSLVALGQCVTPKFRKGTIWKNSDSAIEMQISIRLIDFAPKKLICLAESLRNRYRDHKNITFYIFSSDAAAKHWFPQQEQTKKSAEMEAAMRGAYFYDADKHQEYIVIMPGLRKSRGEAPFDTRIDLPVSGKPECRLEMASRCVLQLQDPDYPTEALKGKVSGTATLVGRIARNGVPTDLHTLKESNVIPTITKEVLVNGALENLRTWRFEPAEHENDLRLVYTYRIDSSLTYENQVNVEFVPPDQMVIRGNPPTN
jgi:hypothetical protein